MDPTRPKLTRRQNTVSVIGESVQLPDGKPPDNPETFRNLSSVTVAEGRTWPQYKKQRNEVLIEAIKHFA